MVKPPLDIDAIALQALKPLTLGLLEEIARLSTENGSLREEIARLKGLKGKPEIKASVKPSGMDKATDAGSGRKQRREKRRRGAKKPTAPVEERVVSAANLPAGARFKGYETFTVQDLKIEARVVCYRRERWLLPDGRTVVAPLPAGIGDHFGPELKRFILAQYHQGQTTVPRLVELLGTLGMDISKRQVVRILTETNEAFIQAGSGLKPAMCCGRGFPMVTGFQWTIPAPAIGAKTASAPRSATTPSPFSPPRGRKAAPIFSICCAPVMATLFSTIKPSPTCAAAISPAR